MLSLKKKTIQIRNKYVIEYDMKKALHYAGLFCIKCDDELQKTVIRVLLKIN